MGTRAGRDVTRAILRTLLVLLLTSCSAPERNVRVEIRNFVYSPAVVTVSPGDTVVFHNRDVLPHTATATGTFDSDSIGHEGEWKWVARGSGNVDYICAYHPNMKGTVTVR